MENTLENKAKFFAQYWGSKVNIKGQLFELNSIEYDGWLEESFLELKSLSQITDEDLKAIGFSNIKDYKVEFNFQSYEMNWKSSCGNYGTFLLRHFDYLRSKGYALPYLGLSVEKQIEYGWIKLTE